MKNLVYAIGALALATTVSEAQTAKPGAAPIDRNSSKFRPTPTRERQASGQVAHVSGQRIVAR